MAQSATRTAITIGNFDGVHRAHAALVARCRELVGSRGRVVVLSFDPHPVSILRPGSEPARLSTFDQRAGWLRACGADDVVRLTPDQALLTKSPQDFIDGLVREFAPGWIVEGDDFHFGRARAGSVQTLQDLGPSRGFSVEVLPPIDVTLSDDLIVRASSSITRWLITEGRIRDASIVLGRPYELTGTVIQGDQRGRTIGFPTANLETALLLPADGVYAGLATLPDGREFAAAINVGTRPTFDGQGRRLEAHLLDASGLPGYDWPLTLKLIAWVRDDARFESIPALVDQIRRDCDRVRELINLNNHNPIPRPWRSELQGITS